MRRLGAAVAPLFAALLLAELPARADVPPVRVVIFTHVEDNTPGGHLGSAQSRQNYLTHRANLIAMASLAGSAGVQWTLQPDWKILEAALLYEDAALRATTNGKNFLRYLKEDRGAVIDPLVSGVWRPRDRDRYFDHDPAANIVAIGQWKHSIATIAELIALYRSGIVPPSAMLTFSCNINPATLATPGGLAAVADTVIAPLVAWRDSGLVVMTDFTSLVGTWESAFGGQGYLYDAKAEVVGVLATSEPTASLALAPCAPDPVRSSARFAFSLGRAARVRLAIFDLQGREVAVLADGPHPAGAHSVAWDARGVAAGVYLCRLSDHGTGGATGLSRSRRLVIVR